MPSHLPVSQVARTGSQVPVLPAVSRTRGDQVPSSPLNQVRPAEPRIQQRASRARQQIDPDSDSKAKKRRGPPLGGGDLDEEVDLPPAPIGYGGGVTFIAAETVSENADASGFANPGADIFSSPDPATRRHSAFRFEAVGIPQGATVVSATLRATYSSSVDMDGVIFAEDADDSASFTVTPNINSRARTSESVAWQETGTEGSVTTSPDFTDVLQEVIDRPGWSSGNDITVIVQGGTGGASATFDVAEDVELLAAWE